MNENINLCKLLKGHKDEKFYSVIYGEIRLLDIDISNAFPIKTDACRFMADGRYSPTGEIVFFPSKDQQDWNKWAEEQKSKIPKTWSELMYDKRCIVIPNSNCNTPFEKAAIAFLKIYQLIEFGYGGNITNNEWKNNWHSTIRVDVEGKPFIKSTYNSTIFPIAFHTKKQAKEFMSYSENVQLIKDFFMI